MALSKMRDVPPESTVLVQGVVKMRAKGQQRPVSVGKRATFHGVLLYTLLTVSWGRYRSGRQLLYSPQPGRSQPPVCAFRHREFGESYCN